MGINVKFNIQCNIHQRHQQQNSSYHNSSHNTSAISQQQKSIQDSKGLASPKLTSYKGTAEKCKFVGETVRHFNAGKPATFEMFAPGAKKGDVEVNIISPEKRHIPHKVVDSGNGVFRIEFTTVEDIYFLIKKAVSIRKHLERNRKDKDAKFRLILVESRIHRLARYYKTKSVLPPTWKYESSTASTLVA